MANVINLVMIAEVQAATPIDFGVTIPPGCSLGPFELWGKNGPTPGTGWQQAPQSGTARCGDAPVGYDISKTITTDTGDGTTLQVRIVPDSGANVRGRLVVHYNMPAPQQ